MSRITFVLITLAMASCTKPGADAATPPASGGVELDLTSPAQTVELGTPPLQEEIDLSAPPAAPRHSPGQPVVQVRLKEVDERGYPVVIMKNVSDHAIDDLRGGFRLLDQDGNVVHATAMTESTPGTVLLMPGAEMETVPNGLNRNLEIIETLRTEPARLSFEFETREVTFMPAAPPK